MMPAPGACPSVSAIVPVHNGAGRIAETLRAIRAQLHPVSEVIVVDDGSTDFSAEAALRADPAAILIRQARQGPAGARNAGAARARGDFLAFLDHDDSWPPERTGALIAGALARPDAGLICGRVRIEADEGVTVDARLRRADGTHVPFLFTAVLVRRETWLEAGGMDPDRDYAEDVDLYLRLIGSGVRVATVEATTLIYRQHGGNRSRRVALSSAALLMAMRSAILRRRTAHG